MSALSVILCLIVAFNSVFAFVFMRDLWRHRDSFLREPGNSFGQALTAACVFFLSSFGLSDFAISMPIYMKFRWVPIVRLPGTLNAQCVLPTCVMALIYLRSIRVDLLTLVVCIVTQIIGAYFGARVVVRLNPWMIKRVLVVSLLVAAGLIFAGKIGLMPSGGTAMAITGPKLWLLGALSLLYGALVNVGIGSYALIMATVYAMGMDPHAAFPLMMGASTFAVPVSGSKFVLHDRYSRKITFMCATFGLIGVFIATRFVQALDLSWLQWIIIISLIYAAWGLFLDIRRSTLRRDAGMATAALKIEPEKLAELRKEFEKSRSKEK